jgi:alpha-tubulin suppressor-like RCC1 family protein
VEIQTAHYPNPSDEKPLLIQATNNPITSNPTLTIVPTDLPVPTETATIVTTPLPPVEEMLALGDYHTCRLHSDGTVSCWGWNKYGQAGTPASGDVEESYLFDLTGITQITAGAYHSCALDWLGRVFCWGRNNVGQLGNNQEGDSYQPVEVTWIAEQEIVQISAGSMHTCALAATGKLYCWGSNHAGKLGVLTSEDYSGIPLPVSGISESIVQVSAGGNHTCAVGVSGSVWCWGDGKDGQMSQGVFEDSYTPVKIKDLPKPVIKVSSGWYHVCSLLTNGSVYCWGGNDKGQLGNASTKEQARVVPATGLYENVTFLAVGGSQSCAIKSGVIFCWGDDNLQPVGASSNFAHLTPYIINFRGRIHNIFLGGSHACVITDIGEVQCWGANDHAQLGDYAYHFKQQTPIVE